MVAGLTYNTYVAELATLAVVSPTDTNFVANLPSAIDYAELRCYQDLDLLSTVTPVVSPAVPNLTALASSYTFPIGTFITLQDINVITGSASPDTGTRNPLLPVSKEFLQLVYPSASGAGLPGFFAMINQNTIALGPWPDQAYPVEMIGTVRPTSLSAVNTTTFLSTYLPSLFLMASMVFISGYQRNFSKQSDDPQMAVSYEAQYQALLKSALLEEVRKKFQAPAWTSMSPSPTATPARG